MPDEEVGVGLAQERIFPLGSASRDRSGAG